MDKREKRYQRETQRETQNKQSKEFKLFDKETKEYSYSVIFTNDLKEIFDAKNDCKALFEKDQDNDFFYCFDKTGKYVKCISQENNFNGTWNEFRSYSMIQWSNSECIVIYLKDYSETTIENILEAYLLENESLCLENGLIMENDMENTKTLKNGIELIESWNGGFYQAKMDIQEISFLDKDMSKRLKQFCKENEIDNSEIMFNVNFYLTDIKKSYIEVETIEIINGLACGSVIETTNVDLTDKLN